MNITSLNKFLNENGFLVIRNVLNDEDIKYGQNCFKGTKVNYTKIDKFINESIINNFNRILNKNLINTKYRVSNQNNSVDAGAFHRDIHNYTNIHDKNPLKIYTCLCYLDTAHMELIPKSHKNSHMSFLYAKKFYNNKIELIINPGDLLIFNANTIHRGIFYKTKHNKNRRLIQCFDCINENIFDKLNSQTLHIPCGPFCNNTHATAISKINKNKFFSNIINKINYYNIACGYGYPFGLNNKISNNGKYLYISPESNQERLKPIGNSWEKGNVYIIKKKTNDIQKEKFYMYKIYSYYLGLILYTILYIILLILLVLFIKYISKYIYDNNKKEIKRIKKIIF